LHSADAAFPLADAHIGGAMSGFAAPTPGGHSSEMQSCAAESRCTPSEARCSPPERQSPLADPRCHAAKAKSARWLRARWRCCVPRRRRGTR
jgi:hypothetical protein